MWRKSLLTSYINAAMIGDRMKDKKSYRYRRFTTWLIPGLGVKRWLLVIILGTTLLGVGLGVLLLDIYRTAPETWWLPFLSTASLRFLTRPLRVLIFGSIGVGLIVTGILGLNRSIITPFVKPGDHVADTLLSHRLRKRGPRIVAIGGGHATRHIVARHQGL